MVHVFGSDDYVAKINPIRNLLGWFHNKTLKLLFIRNIYFNSEEHILSGKVPEVSESLNIAKTIYIICREFYNLPILDA